MGDQRKTDGDLGERVARLEAAVAALGAEVRTGRLVVVDQQARPRIVAEVVDGTAEVRLDLPGGGDRSALSVLVFANPGDRELDLAPGVGVQLWVDGDEVDRLVAWGEGRGQSTANTR
ncbi:MAG TPA: hypothetical protein VHB02_03195 [Acidimicrobiales bacterium]|nr:hypothetical protein [Acidimicrobiales bacterium]